MEGKRREPRSGPKDYGEVANIKLASSNFVIIGFALVALLPGGIVRAGVPRDALSLTAQATTTDTTSERPNDPIEEEPLPKNLQLRAARLAKNLRYNTHGPDLTKLASDEHIINQTWPRTEFIPVSQSAVVVLGRVIKTQPYLSEDRSQIYTEITATVETVFKNRSRNLLSSDNKLVVDTPGGVLRLLSGRVVHDETKVEFLGKPYVGGLFALFAKKIHAGKDLALIRAYELRDGRVFELADDGTPGNKLVSTSAGVAGDLSQQETFLQAVRKRSTAPNEHH